MTHRTDPETGRPVCGGKGATVDTNPTCLDCRDIERNHPRLLWTAEQHKQAAVMFVATFEGGK
jgi:hypothetical protein